MNKKLISMLVLGALTVLVAPSQKAEATSNSGNKSITVTYNNQTTISDPDKPGAPAWEVVIPSGVNFDENNKTVKTELELKATKGHTLDTATNVEISVESKNSYKLKMDTSEIAYTLAYGTKTLTTQDKEVGTLNSTTPKIEGQAALQDTSVATSIGNHTDTLTYTIQLKATT